MEQKDIEMERASFYGIIDSLLADVPKAKRQAHENKIALAQECNLIGTFDWTGVPCPKGEVDLRPLCDVIKAQAILGRI